MRINKYIAQATGMSRRAADTVIAEGRVLVNGTKPSSGLDISSDDTVLLDGKPLAIDQEKITIMMNKPAGYVVSRNGQGSRTVYNLLPEDLQHLKPVGRLDKQSSGLLLLTNDGDLANELTHPSHQKRKLYEVTLNAPLQPLHRQIIADKGITLEDGLSKLGLERLHDSNDQEWLINMHEGRNRQIRRTFEAVGYQVSRLHRIEFGSYALGEIKPAHFVSLY
jgi:23S rRNA pseudouridine2605 synthase